MKESGASIKGLLNRYRVEVYCFNCGANYVTRLLQGQSPIECKVCRSRKIRYVKKWKL